jgi:uridine kinase
MHSDELVGYLAALARERGATTVAVDGPDAAGKTTLADALAAALGAARISIDDHLRPGRERVTPEGCYDSFDLAAVRRAVAKAEKPVVVDGVFAQREELRDLWDLTVYLHVEPEETLRRALIRDTHAMGSEQEVERRYATRYLPAQARYREMTDPATRADVTVDNTDPERPVILP